MKSGKQNQKKLKRYKANLVYWIRQLKKDKPISLKEEGANLARAIEFGLSENATLALAADLLIQLHPLVMRSHRIRDWLPYYQVARKRASALSLDRQVNLYNQLGAINWQLGRNASALIEFGHAQRQAKHNGLNRQEAAALLGSSIAKWSAHDYKNAFLEARRAVRRFRRKLGEDVLLSRLIAVKGVTAYAAEEFDIAETCFREARKLPGWQDLASQVQFQINIALIESRDKARYAGEKRLKRLVNKLHGESEAVNYLGRIELLRAVLCQHKGDIYVSLKILERALEAGLLTPTKEAERAMTESALGRILWAKGKPKKARVWLKSASVLWEKLNDPWMVLDTLQILDGIGAE